MHKNHWTLTGAAVLVTALLAGCHPDMWNQPRIAAHQRSDFFKNQSGARNRVPGTIEYAGERRGWRNAVFAENSGEAVVPSVMDEAFYTGRNPDGSLVADNYFQVDEALLARGRERFQINCMHCHGPLGDGNGVVTKRGFPPAATYHIDRLREVEDGYIVDVIKNGFGRMYPHAARVAPEDRWAIAAYIRALQLSQNADISDASPAMAQEVADHMKQAAEQPHETDGNAH